MTDNYKPFDNAEEVWFWYCNCLVIREDGLRSKGEHNGTPRICEVSDIAKIIKYMRMRSEVSPRHLRVMYRFGALNVPPYYDKRAKNSEVNLWDEGIKIFESYLLAKRIIADSWVRLS